MAPVQILVADDHDLIRKIIRSLLGSRSDWEVCGEAVDGYDAIEKARQLKPDVILLDITMPNLNGLDAARVIRQEVPQSKILIVSQHDPMFVQSKVSEVGASGYVTKANLARDLLEAVEAISQHKQFSTPQVPPSNLSASDHTSGNLESAGALLSLILEATRALLADPRLDFVLPPLFKLVRQFIPADAQAVWRFHEAESEWRVLGSEGLSSEYAHRFIKIGRKISEPIVVPDVTFLPKVLETRRELYYSEGIRALIAVPLYFRTGVGGTLVLYFRKPREFGEIELKMTNTLANLTALAIEASEFHEARERDHRRFKFLAEASTVLIASPDYQRTLAGVAKNAVPHIADWCVIDLGNEDGTVHRVAVEHADPAKVEFALEITRRFPSHPGLDTSRIMRTGVAGVYPEITSQMIEAAIKDPDHREMVRQLGIRSAIVVPMVTRHGAVGVITLVMAESGRRFDRSDLPFVEDLARHAAIAVDSARLQSALRQNEERMRFSLEAANVGTWDFNIRTGEVRWSDNLEMIHGMPPGSFGRNFQSFLDGVLPDDRQKVLKAVEQSLATGDAYHTEYRQIRSGGVQGWMESSGRVIFDENHRPVRMIGVCMDITERKRAEEALRMAHDGLEARVKERTAELEQAEQSLRDLTGRILRLQDEERGHIARELHDSAGQLLTALSTNLCLSRRELAKVDPGMVKPISESIELADQLFKELRTISHLLHPPLLDEAGLPSAIRLFVEGFAERSKLAVELELSSDLGRLSRESETAIFRLVQEGLTNIHRHSGSSTAAVRVTRDTENIRVEICDWGKGMPATVYLPSSGIVKPGIGIQGMRERLRQLGGRLEIQSGSSGTQVTGVLPGPNVSDKKSAQNN